MNILETIQKLIKSNYPQIKEKINLTTVLGNVEYLDSLELAIIAVEIEKIYKIRFPDHQLEEIKKKTVKEIITEIESLLNGKNNS